MKFARADIIFVPLALVSCEVFNLGQRISDFGTEFIVGRRDVFKTNVLLGPFKCAQAACQVDLHCSK